MVNDIFTYIGLKLKLANTWIDTYSVNCIELPYIEDGKTKKRIVQIEGDEKQEVSINDFSGSGFYIKINPQFNYQEQRALSSSQTEYLVTVNFRFVFFEIGTSHEKLTLENKFANDLRGLSFKEYTGGENSLKLSIVSSNFDAQRIFKDESGLDYESGSEVNLVAFDGRLTFLSKNICDESCGYSTSDSILKGFDFCDPNIFSLLSEEQKNCLSSELCSSTDCSGTINVYLDGVLIDTQTTSDFNTETVNIEWL